MSAYLETLATDKTDQAIITPASGKKIYVRWVMLDNPTSATANMELKFGGTAHYESEPGGRTTTDERVSGAVDQALTITGVTGSSVEIDYDEV